MYQWLQDMKTEGKLIEWVWLGLQDQATEGQFVYHSNGQPASFVNWKSGQPNGGENCVFFGYDHNGQWYDSPCSWTLQYLCEIRLS